MHLSKRLPYGLLFLSGFAGLGYEMVWVRALSAGLGHEIVSVLAVMAAFFVGTAAGAWLLDRPIRTGRAPRYWYAGLEILIALWAVVLSFMIPQVAAWGAGFMGVQPSALLQWSVTFLLPLALLLPATLAMGATLPAMECLAVRLRQEEHLVGGLYGANTLGAVAGTLAATYWLVPSLGFTHTQHVLAAASMICALGVLGLRGGGVRHQNGTAAAFQAASSVRRLLVTLFCTGLLGIGYEVLAVRILSQLLENTVFSYAALLAVYLLGTAAGAAFYQARLAGRAFIPTLSGLLAAQALTCTAGMWALNFGAGLYTRLVPAGAQMAEFGTAASIFLVPVIVMGALFSHLAQAARLRFKGLGTALAVNTLGGALAPILFGIVLLPAWGPSVSLLALCMGYLLLLPGFGKTAGWSAAGCALAAGLILTVESPFDFNHLTPGEEVVAHRHGIMADLAVIRDGRQDYHLKVNNHYQMGGTASRYSDRRQAHIPLLLHPHPRRVLFLGLGTGTTFATAAQYTHVEADGVELIPEVIPLMTYFAPLPTQTMSRDNLHIYTADARRFVLARQDRYDVIIADLFHPSRDGAGFLYTSEHFRAVRRRLSDDGIFCQWLPLYQMDLDLLRLIVRTFLEVFPQGTAFMAHHSLTQPIIGLVGGRRDLRIEAGDLERHMTADPALAEELRSVGLNSVYTLLGCFLADDQQLREFAGRGPMNTDDLPRVLFQAPEFVYTAAPSSGAADRLMTLVETFRPQSEGIMAQSSDVQKRRLAAYWQARDVYLHIGTRARPARDLKRMVAQVVEPLLDVVHLSPDFEAAYRPLLAMAARLHQHDPQMAEKLLTALQAAGPDRPEAGRLRQALFKGS